MFFWLHLLWVPFFSEVVSLSDLAPFRILLTGEYGDLTLSVGLNNTFLLALCNFPIKKLSINQGIWILVVSVMCPFYIMCKLVFVPTELCAESGCQNIFGVIPTHSIAKVKFHTTNYQGTESISIYLVINKLF